MKFVPMREAHLAAIAELERQCFSAPWSEDALREELGNDCACFLTAEDEESGAVCGYIGCHIVLDEGYIANVAVSPDCRRQGIGTKLVREMIRQAQERGLAFLTLEVRASNYGAIALYGERGFRSVGRRKNYYEHPKEDAVIMTKEFDYGTETADH